MTFVKGKSGNPSGRPKQKRISDALIAALISKAEDGELTKAQAIAMELVDLAIGGDVQAAKLVLAYTEGLPKQPVDVTVRREAERVAADMGLPLDEVQAEVERILAARA